MLRSREEPRIDRSGIVSSSTKDGMQNSSNPSNVEETSHLKKAVPSVLELIDIKRSAKMLCTESSSKYHLSREDKGKMRLTSPANLPPDLSTRYVPSSTFFGSAFIQCNAALLKIASILSSLILTFASRRSWASISIHSTLLCWSDGSWDEEDFAVSRRDEEESRPMIEPWGRTAGRRDSRVRAPWPQPKSRIRSCTLEISLKNTVARRRERTYTWLRSEKINDGRSEFWRVDERSVTRVSFSRPVVLLRLVIFGFCSRRHV